MFTGIIEAEGQVIDLKKDRTNLELFIQAPFKDELKIDQSVAHNGCCLTVVEITADWYRVTAIDETLQKTNLGQLKIGDIVNLERCTKIGDRLDGHIVQGHVDATGECAGIENQDGSTIFTFRYTANHITVEKGSITVNGISLTVVNSTDKEFSVAIIPFTLDHTNLRHLKVGDTVNLEFDIIGKYVAKLQGMS
ncbi:MAG: riboflavin synthase [Crocinitomicaceae bacterium]|nr:riboflavin synthase [Crocinitomicaceae bacterium]